MKRLPILLAAFLALPAFAVTTSHWTHTNESDFKDGTMHNVVASNLGDIKLSRAVKTLLEQDADVDGVYALAEGSDKSIYAGSDKKAIVLQIKNDVVKKLATIEEAKSIFSLCAEPNGSLLIGTAGDKGCVYRLEAGSDKPKKIFEAEGVQYIWKIVRTADGNLYVATGPEGQLYEITPDGKSRVLFDCDENNILSLIADDKDNLYLGTDPNGLIYRVNRKTGESFVLYDAPETEISALALDSKGNLFSATGQTSENVGPGVNHEDPVAEPKGRPEAAPKEKGMPDDAIALGFADEKKPDEHGEASHSPKMPKPVPPGPTLQGNNTPPLEGNAIYKIDSSGMVTEIFRNPSPFVSLIESNGKLLAGTGDSGQIYQFNPGSDETLVLAKVDSKSVASMLSMSDGRIMLGLADTGSIAVMDKGFAGEGTYTSAVLDATQISQFGKLQLHSATSEGTTLKVATRSGNLQEPDDKSWSKWSEDVPAAEFISLKAPAARFFQYRLTLTSSKPDQTPVLEDIDIAYLQPNLAPKIVSVKIAPSEKNKPQGEVAEAAPSNVSQRHQTITWECADANNDSLEYELYFRSLPKGQWILLKDKIKELTYEWDTRSIGDGRYEIKLVASDVKANPSGIGKTSSRVSDPIVVDNTPPNISGAKVITGANGLTIDCQVDDKTSTIASLEYAIDSATDWQAAAASDNIFDQASEAAQVKITGLAAGSHQITLRATDARGNQAFESVTVRIEGPTASK